MKEAYFSTKKLTVGYQGRPLIREIQISLKKGEILTLIGPNGAGKSTILKSIARQLELLGGSVYLDGKSVNKMSRGSLAQSMAVMLTDKRPGGLMTCEEVVAAGRYPYTGRFGLLSETDKRVVAETLRLTGAENIGRQLFSEVSDGQKQRILLARALCQEPQIILLDEPTSYLDVKYKLEFLDILQRLKEGGITVIMSLHELELAERISDRILCVKGEYADRFGTPEEIFTPGYLARLFDISVGSFDEENQSMELEPPRGKAEVFVIGGKGRGRKAYRRLQRQNRAFVTGILFENDLDYPQAKRLAAEVFFTEAFEPVRQEVFERAAKQLLLCKEVICCRRSFGSWEEENHQLLLMAEEADKIILWQE